MQEQQEQGICPQCRGRFVIKRGHQRRKYCSDRCKQTAFRRRHGSKARPTKEALAIYKRAMRMQEMERQEWPGLSFGTYHLLCQIEEKHGKSLAAKVAEAIVWEKQAAARNRNGENSPGSGRDE